MNANQTTYISLYAVARTLGVPAAWLRREADAGRIPVVRAGKRTLANVDAVRAALEKNSAPGVCDAK